MAEEKRRYARLNASVDVHWSKIVDPGEKLAYNDNITKNISEGGICLLAYEKAEVGDILDLVFELPTQKVIRSKAQVRWVKEFRMGGEKAMQGYDIGLEFLDILNEDRKEIKNFIFSLLPSVRL
jgi:c-di-GMP-binding flagellar brake protein YcgR